MTKNKDVVVPKTVQYVVDGGALVHRVPWTHQATFADILEAYSSYVVKKYGNAVIVFDGYRGASTKDMTHRRRTKGKKGPTVSVTKEMRLTVSKDSFLSDLQNKQHFVELLGQHLENAGCAVFHATSDADVLIVQKAVESAEVQDTVLVGDDTDLLVLSLHHEKPSQNLYLAPQPKRNAKARIWDIKQVKNDLGPFIRKHILFLHVFLGCDTTSRILGIGKGTILKKFKGNFALTQAANVFDSPTSNQAEIATAGEKAFVALYNGKAKDSLNTLRFSRYCEKVAKNLNKVEPRSLPPTSAAAKFHSYRVFLQVCQWKNHQCDLQADSWGWTHSDMGYFPIPTDLAPAPADLLKIIRCNCTTDCSSSRCSCQKHGMKCSMACGQCRGTACTNAGIMIEDADDEQDLE